MNKKGITLIEIIISVSLISVVMLFLFRLLTDMQYEEDHASFAKENQLIRTEVIKKVQDDFMNLDLKNASLSGDKRTITFTFKDNSTKTLSLNDRSINYNNEQTWNLEGNESTKIDLSKISLEKKTQDTGCNSASVGLNCSSYFSIRIVLPVTTGEKENIIDDIEFFYVGRS